MAVNLSSPADVSALLRRHGLRPKKRLGQNFLVDRNTLEKIAAAAELVLADRVLEIGPGLGALTRTLAERAGRVAAVEVDADLLPILTETLAGRDNVEIVHADFLQLPLPSFLTQHLGDAGIKVVANIPYYITSPIVEQLLAVAERLERVILLVQREVAERLTARPGTPEYGSFTLFVRYYAEVEVLGRVSRHVFLPPPTVDSAIVRLRLRPEPAVRVTRPERLFDVIHAAFQQRRKILLNALTGFAELHLTRSDAEAALEAAGIDPQRRGETLSLEEFARLADAVVAGETRE
jgi:16S rRNA (adenine1518-N6/adenine1519-N6)-dimethyltransferase